MRRQAKKESKSSRSVQMHVGSVKKTKWIRKTAGNWFVWEKRGQILEGYLIDAKIQKGQFGKQKVFSVKVAEDEVYSLSGTVLASALEGVKIGVPVRVVYLGEVKKGKNTYKNFDVFTG